MEPSHQESRGWAPSIYYAESRIDCALEKAWQMMLDYQVWNPSFLGAQVVRLHGEPHTEGELVLIRKALLTSSGEPWPEFYAETVKLVPECRIVWYLYPKEGEAFRNFVDFKLAEAGAGVRFSIDYYAQTRLSGRSLLEERKEMTAALRDLAAALKNHCEGSA